jgi:hypothetical protein
VRNGLAYHGPANLTSVEGGKSMNTESLNRLRPDSWRKISIALKTRQ